MTKHLTGTRTEWLTERLELLKAEKELTRRSDELARRRQELPWVRIDFSALLFAPGGAAGTIALNATPRNPDDPSPLRSL
jgi:predicted dithiol-disulfide oxidoreductase (DUF899 family)